MDNPKLKISLAKKEDIDELNAINKKLQKKIMGKIVPGFGINAPTLKDIQKDKDKVLILKQDGKTIGFSWMHHNLNYGHIALAGIALIEKYREPRQADRLWNETFKFINKRFSGIKIWGQASEMPYRKRQIAKYAVEARVRMLKKRGFQTTHCMPGEVIMTPATLRKIISKQKQKTPRRHHA